MGKVHVDQKSALIKEWLTCGPGGNKCTELYAWQFYWLGPFSLSRSLALWICASSVPSGGGESERCEGTPHPPKQGHIIICLREVRVNSSKTAKRDQTYILQWARNGLTTRSRWTWWRVRFHATSSSSCYWTLFRRWWFLARKEKRLPIYLRSRLT